MCDRRKNYRMVRKMFGSKGSVRDACLVEVPGLEGSTTEVVVTAGCDRFLRVFDPYAKFKHQTEIGHVYLKQRLNCIQMF